MARHGYRPINAGVLERHRDRLPKLDLFPITLIAKDWDDAQAKFFADNALFDVIYNAKPKGP
jgi:sulfate transport system substrate-binding protein